MTQGTPDWREFRQLRYSAGGYVLTRELSQRLGAVIAWAGFRAGLSPSALTLAGLGLMLAGSAFYAIGAPGIGAATAALLLYQLGYGFDCADGQLARATGSSSAFGAWLDLGVDYIRCIVVGSAVVVVLVRGHQVPIEAAVAPGLLLTCGMTLSAHTGIQMRHAPRAATAAAPGGLRALVRIIIDTPFLLLALCLLRDEPRALAPFAVVMGIADLGIATTLARRRLGPSDV